MSHSSTRCELVLKNQNDPHSLKTVRQQSSTVRFKNHPPSVWMTSDQRCRNNLTHHTARPLSSHHCSIENEYTANLISLTNNLKIHLGFGVGRMLRISLLSVIHAVYTQLISIPWSLTVHLSFIWQYNLPPSTGRVDGQGLLEALLDVRAPDPLRVPVHGLISSWVTQSVHVLACTLTAAPATALHTGS